MQVASTATRSAGEHGEVASVSRVQEIVSLVVKPLKEEVQDNGHVMRELVQVVRQLGERLEKRLQEERRHMEQRFQRQEDLFCQHSESRLRQLNQHLDAVHEVQRQAAQTPAPPGPNGLVELVAPLEARLERIEAGLIQRNSLFSQRSMPPEEESDQRGYDCDYKEYDQKSDHQPRTPPCEDSDGKPGKGDSKAMARRAGSTEALSASSHITRFGSFSSTKFRQAKVRWPASTRSHSREQHKSFCGLEYEELLHYQNMARNTAQRRCYGLLLALIDWLYTLKEPPRSGLLAGLIKTKAFEGICAMVIVANAVFMVPATNASIQNLYTDTPSIEAGEYVFLFFYLAEVFLKLVVHRLYFFVGVECQWNIFDFVLVLLALVDELVSVIFSQHSGLTSDATALRSLRILKLAKILRVMRILRVFVDLRLMLTSVIGSCISLLWSFVMLAFVYYLFGLVFVQSLTLFLLDGGGEVLVDVADGPDLELKGLVMKYFGSVEKAMASLWIATMGGNDWNYLYSVVVETGVLNSILFVFFIGFIQISLMNILTAVFVERAMRLAQPDTMAQAREQRMKERSEAEELRRMCLEMDANNSGTVSADEFREHIESQEMRCYFSVLGLDIRNAQEFFEMLVFISDGQEVDIDTFVEGCMQMRGHATGIAQQNLIMETRLLRRAQNEHFAMFSKRLDALSARILRVEAHSHSAD